MMLGNVVMTNVIIGIVFTLIILVLSLIAISKGYKFQHSVDQLPDNKGEQGDQAEADKNDERTDK